MPAGVAKKYDKSVTHSSFFMEMVEKILKIAVVVTKV